MINMSKAFEKLSIFVTVRVLCILCFSVILTSEFMGVWREQMAALRR